MGWQGHRPAVAVRPVERVIYETLWQLDDYRAVAPGELCAHEFMEVVRPTRGAKLLDLGCGTGRGGMALAVMGDLNVTFVDFAKNCLDPDVAATVKASDRHAFLEFDLTKGVPDTAKYGFCTDCMEHIHPSKVDVVLDNILRAAEHVYFQIATEDDHFGAVVGHKLHLTVQPYEWWLQKFAERGCSVLWSKKGNGCCAFYVSAWMSAASVSEAGRINVTEERILENVKANAAAGWKQVIPHAANDFEVMIVGGGPTLPQYLGEIKSMRNRGVKLVTLNGAYNWCLENGLTPSAQVMVDARPFNARFTKPVTDTTIYLISSQCDPSVLEGLPKDRTYLWHTQAEKLKDALIEHYPFWFSIPGGSTVLLRAIPLLRMLGYKKFTLFGCDSCFLDDKHHAYSQPENDGSPIVPVTFGTRVFNCAPWMAAQAGEFIEMVKRIDDDVELSIRGDGLLAYILEHCAELDGVEIGE